MVRADNRRERLDDLSRQFRFQLRSQAPLLGIGGRCRRCPRELDLASANNRAQNLVARVLRSNAGPICQLMAKPRVLPFRIMANVKLSALGGFFERRPASEMADEPGHT